MATILAARFPPSEGPPSRLRKGTDLKSVPVSMCCKFFAPLAQEMHYPIIENTCYQTNQNQKIKTSPPNADSDIAEPIFAEDIVRSTDLPIRP